MTSNGFQPFAFQSFSEAANAPQERTSFVVDGLLPSGGLSILAGKPKAGKSSVSRQLAVAVVQGMPFMGRETVQGSVLYIALEEKQSEVVEHFKALGLRESDQLELICGSVDRSKAIGMLEATLMARNDVRLVIIDPVFRFVGVKDNNDYVQVNNALEKLLDVSRKYGCHVLTVHHMKKKDTEDAMDQVLGSTAIAGAVDSIIALKVNGSGQRTMRTSQRYGTDMEETQLNWNPDKRSVSVGVSVAEADERDAQKTQSRIESAMIGYVTENPDCEQAQIYTATTGNATLVKTVFRQLKASGVLVESGQGVKGAPFTYRVADMEYAM